MLAREVLLRKCHDRNAPGVQIIVDVIAEAIHETAYKTRGQQTTESGKQAAEAFLSGGEGLSMACELAGLEPHFVRFVAERVRGS